MAWAAVWLAPVHAAGNPQWELRSVPVAPSPRAEFGFAYDTGRGRAVLFGGSSDLTFAAVNRETWEWDGLEWELVENAAGPSLRCDNAMAFDAARGEVVSFGGYNGSFFSDTWAWDGSSWASKPGAGPSARADSFMVFDSTNDVLVLFGGLPPAGPLRDDTWFWNGTTWAQQSPATVPPRRWIQRMAYDSARGVTVMFGGLGAANSVLSDTWEFDGTNWTQRFPANSPPGRYGAAIAYDSDRQITVMFGGQTGSAFGDGVLSDTWEWDGTNWTQLSSPGPLARTFTKMVYETQRRRMVLFGGYDGTQMVSDTWELASGPVVPAVSEWGLAILTLLALTAGTVVLRWLPARLVSRWR